MGNEAAYIDANVRRRGARSTHRGDEALGSAKRSAELRGASLGPTSARRQNPPQVLPNRAAIFDNRREITNGRSRRASRDDRGRTPRAPALRGMTQAPM